MKFATSIIFKIMTLISFCIFIANCVMLSYQYQLLDSMTAKRFRKIYVDELHPERLPGDFENVAMNFEENTLYSIVNDHAWARLLPENRGFVRMGPKGRPFAISVYHQLHCINAIRFWYTVARDGLIKDFKMLERQVAHDNHCFQFLRQSIWCKSDNALIRMSGRNVSVVDAGIGSTHRCKNWAKVGASVSKVNAQWAGVPYPEEFDVIEAE